MLYLISPFVYYLIRPIDLLKSHRSMHAKSLIYLNVEARLLQEIRVSCSDAALYATPNDISELADKIIYLTDNPDIRLKAYEYVLDILS